MDTESNALSSARDAAADGPHPDRAAVAQGADRKTAGARSAMPAASLLAATDLQDHLLVATNDLDRLHRLLADASEALTGHFHGAAALMKQVLREAAKRGDMDTAALNAAMDHLAAAITSLQFQDMASQLLTHTHRRLRSCADRLAAEAIELDEDEEAFLDTVPLTPNPVTQDEMDAGSIELF